MGEETLQQLLEKLQGAQDRTAAAAAVTLVDDIRELLHKQLKAIKPEMGNHATEPTCVAVALLNELALASWESSQWLASERAVVQSLVLRALETAKCLASSQAADMTRHHLRELADIVGVCREMSGTAHGRTALLHAGAVPALLGSLEPVLDLYFLYSSSNESCTVPSLPPTASLCESRSIPAAAPSTTTVASSTTTTSRAQRSGSSHYEAGAEIVPTRGGSDAELDPTGSAAALDVGSESGSDGEETEDERAEAAEGVLQVLQRLMLESPTAPALGQLGLPPSPEIESDCSESRAGKRSTARTCSTSASTSVCAVLRRAILVSEPGGSGRVRSLAAAVLARCAMESVAEDNRVASPTSKGLGRLLWPMSEREFMQCFWEHQPAHIQQCQRESCGASSGDDSAHAESKKCNHHRFAGLAESLLAEDEERSRSQVPPPTRLVRSSVACASFAADECDPLRALQGMLNLEGSVFGGPPIHGQDVRLVRCVAKAGAVSPLEECWMANGEAVGSTHVAEAFAAGYSVTVRGVHARDAQAAALAEGLGYALGLSVGANLYVTPRGSQGLQEHYDDHCVLVLQLAGQKKWTVRSAVGAGYLHPRLYSPRQPPRPIVDPQDVREFVLSPGDVMYIPRGWPHQAAAMHEGTEGSAHLTLAIEVEPPFDWEGAIHVAMRIWALDHQLAKSNTQKGRNDSASQDVYADGNSSGKRKRTEGGDSTVEAQNIIWWGAEALFHVALDTAGAAHPLLRKACVASAEGACSSIESLDELPETGSEEAKTQYTCRDWGVDNKATFDAIMARMPLVEDSCLSTGHKIHQLSFSNALHSSRLAVQLAKRHNKLHPHCFDRLGWLELIGASSLYLQSIKIGSKDIEGRLRDILGTDDYSSHVSGVEESTALHLHECTETIDQLRVQYNSMISRFKQEVCWEKVCSEVRRIANVYSHSRTCLNSALKSLHGA